MRTGICLIFQLSILLIFHCTANACKVIRFVQDSTIFDDTIVVGTCADILENGAWNAIVQYVHTGSNTDGTSAGKFSYSFLVGADWAVHSDGTIIENDSSVTVKQWNCTPTGVTFSENPTKKKMFCTYPSVSSTDSDQNGCTRFQVSYTLSIKTLAGVHFPDYTRVGLELDDTRTPTPASVDVWKKYGVSVPTPDATWYTKRRAINNGTVHYLPTGATNWTALGPLPKETGPHYVDVTQ